MLKIVGSEYRDDILRYFERKDQNIYKIMKENRDDWGFPFKTIYQIHYNSLKAIDLTGYMLACMTFNRYKPPVKEQKSFSTPLRGTRFLDKLIKEDTIYRHISAMSLSVYVASEMMDRIEVNEDFKQFIKSKNIRGSKADFIIVDTANLYYGIKDYTGNMSNIINLRDNIIGDKSLGACIKDLAISISTYSNGNDYKYIFVTPTNHNIYEDSHVILSADCNDYIGEKCSEENLSNEVDDCLTLMLHDYIFEIEERNASILSQDNYAFSMIMQDYNYHIDRAMFDLDGNVINAQDIEIKYPDFRFPKDCGLSLYSENMGLGEDSD